MAKSVPEITVEGELKIVRRLLALSLVEGKKQRDQIALLGSAGMDRHEIAELIGTTANTVSVELFHVRKRKAVSRGERS